MNRAEIYKAMELEKIIMYDEFRAKLDSLDLDELEARWIGIQELDQEHQVQKHRADWLAMFMWNSTALTVGLAEIARRKEEQRRSEIRRAEAERKRREDEIRQKLSNLKLKFWHTSSLHDKKSIVKNFLLQSDEFAREYVTETYRKKLDSMEDQAVLMWFWQFIPPFSLAEEPHIAAIPTAKAA